MPLTERIEAHPWHYDGRNANRWTPLLVGDVETFTLKGEGWDAGPYCWADLIALDAPAGEHVFGLKDEQGWRLGFPGALPEDLAALLPKPARYGGFIDRIGLGRASAVLAMAAAAVVFVGVKAPGWIAPLVPQSWEDTMGDAMAGDFGGRICHTKEGTPALRALVRQLDPHGTARSIEVANIGMVNAVALPGRRIVLFRGLVEQAESPDEVAGVLGHELGHVRHRDTLTAMMRQLGLSVVLGGMDGSTGSQVNAVLGLSFSRDAEHQADLAAIDAMRASGISPVPTAAFFARMGGEEAPAKAKGKAKSTTQPGRSIEALDWFASHPSSTSRQQLFANAAEKGRRYRPALAADQWQALQKICSADKAVKPGFDFGF
ncbi:M48 family metallopeptidase [Sphingobium subterraneum]|uniref:Zn-dependent protease with chaperone function n=1 Tax=Sphingobium subterraneum TaxID=627688 RepID=A0A841J8J3_9SPHN|nr:M48 family metallopeptidase [Sphingobium subterraneum]MBB6124491.1 Zn-dependent protease with chaperone function [Sphingobium subterraneum]